MENIVAYILQSILVSGILTGYYYIALRNTRSHTLNRFYLVFSLLAALVFPFFRFNWLPVQDTAWFGAAAGLFTGEQQPGSVAATAAGYSWLWMPVAGISTGMLLVLLSKIIWIYRIKQQHRVVKMDGFNFIEIRLRQAPFTFFNNLFWKKGMDPHDGSTRKILRHELVHIKERHTYDRLFAQICSCIFWMNPFFWITRKELTMVHEFIADEGSIEKGDLESFARMLLTSYNNGKYLAPQHSFFQSSIKRRITMLTNNQKPRLLLLRKAFIMPVILTTAIAVGCSKSKNASQQSSSTAATDQVKTAVTVEPEKGAVKMVEPVIPGIQNQPLDSDPGREKIITVHSGANQKSTDNRFKVSFENGGPVISTAK